jgi:hypothetical protein
MKWTKTNIHKVVSEFLRAERDKFNLHSPWLPLIDTPNLSDPLENHKRLRLLYINRAPFMIEIPLDTEWFEVESLTQNEIDELYVSARHNPLWNQAGNKLTEVAKADPQLLEALPHAWAGIILWAHSKDGPFSIFEGNHRLIGYAAADPPPPLNIKVYVGISPSLCLWHYADPAESLGQGLEIFNNRGVVAQDDWLRVVKF